MAISSYPHEFAIRAAAVLGSKIEASITVRQLGLTVRAGSSTDAAARCDQVEAMAGAGPCVDAMDQLVVQLVPEIASESRWEAWRAKAAEEGFTSAIAVPALVNSDVSVALNLYSRSLDPWTPELLTAADAYAHLTASAVRLRFELADVEDAAVGLYRKMSETIATERAVGAIMQSNQCTEDEARRILDSAARNRSVSRREVAETILKALVVPEEPGAAADEDASA